MARIVLTPHGSYGDVLPYVAIARILLSRGHEATVAAPATYRSLVEAEGIVFRACRPDVGLDDLDSWRRSSDQRTGGTVIVRDRLVPSVRDSYEDLSAVCEGADLLVSHVLSYATPILAEEKGIPWVSSALMPLSFMSAYDPPAIASALWFARLRPLGPRIVAALWRVMKSYTKGWDKPIQELRSDVGLAPHPDPLWEGAFSPFGTLALFSTSFAEPQPDWPQNAIACGFSFYDGDFGGNRDAKRLEEFLEGGSRPLVFSLGSTAAVDPGDFHAVAAAVARRLGERAVLVVGDAEVGDYGDDVLVLRTADLGPLFDAASILVHAGGAGTTGLAMRAGRPQIVVPFLHDQFDSALRVHRRGLGVQLKRRLFTDSQLCSLIPRLQASHEMGSRTKEVGLAIRAEQGAESACEALERVLADGSLSRS